MVEHKGNFWSIKNFISIKSTMGNIPKKNLQSEKLKVERTVRAKIKL